MFAISMPACAPAHDSKCNLCTVKQADRQYLELHDDSAVHAHAEAGERAGDGRSCHLRISRVHRVRERVHAGSQWVQIASVILRFIVSSSAGKIARTPCVVSRWRGFQRALPEKPHHMSIYSDGCHRCEEHRQAACKGIQLPLGGCPPQTGALYEADLRRRPPGPPC